VLKVKFGVLKIKLKFSWFIFCTNFFTYWLIWRSNFWYRSIFYCFSRRFWWLTGIVDFWTLGVAKHRQKIRFPTKENILCWSEIFLLLRKTIFTIGVSAAVYDKSVVWRIIVDYNCCPSDLRNSFGHRRRTHISQPTSSSFVVILSRPENKTTLRYDGAHTIRLYTFQFNTQMTFTSRVYRNIEY